MRRNARSLLAAAGVVAMLAACDWAWVTVNELPDTLSAVDIELAVDSLGIQQRDSHTTVTATATSHLGQNIDSLIEWRSEDSSIVSMVHVAPGIARLTPHKAGVAQVRAWVGTEFAAVTVQVHDTVYSVQVTPADSIQSLGTALEYTATVVGPPGASLKVTWSVADSTKASIDSSLGTNPVRVISLDTGSTTVIATSAIDRNRSATAPMKTAAPAALFFMQQPGDNAIVAHAGDLLSPGPEVGVRDALGTAIPFTTPVALALTPGTGPAGAVLFGLPTQPSNSGVAEYNDLRVDRAGSGYQLTATSPGLTAATSQPFTVNAECPATPYTIGNTVNGSLSASSCQLQSGEYYLRFLVTNSGQEYFKANVTSAAGLRIAFVFPDSAVVQRPESLYVVAAAGESAIRVVSSSAGAVGSFQLTSQATPSLPAVCIYQTEASCVRIDIHRGVTISSGPGLRWSNVGSQCSGITAGAAGYRLHLNANVATTLVASSAAFDPCLAVFVLQSVTLVDDNSGGGTTALKLVPATTRPRGINMNVGSNQPAPAGSPFTLTVQP